MLMRVLNGDHAGATFELKQGQNTLGRLPDCDLVIPLPGISKKHAVITLEGDQVTITDLGSSNGTFVNGVRIKTKKINFSVDKIGFHTCLVDFHRGVKKIPTGNRSPIPAQIPSFSDGSALPQMQPINLSQNSEEANKVIAPKNMLESAQHYIDHVMMPGIYHLLENFEFRQVLAAFILAFVVLCTLFATVPVIHLSKSTVESESRRRALTIARSLATSNQSFIQQGLETSVTVRAAENEEGVRIALILSDKDGHVIAPVSQAGSYPDQPFVHKARKINKEMSEQISDDLIGASVPIMVFSADFGSQAAAHAVVLYNMGSLSIDNSRFISLFTQIFAICLALGFLLYFFLMKLAEHPLKDLGDQLDNALKDETKNVSTKFQISELKRLALNINSALARGGGKSDSAIPSVDRHLEAANLIQIFSTPAIAIDKDRLIIAINPSFEDLVGVRQISVQNQSLEILSDQAFKMSIVDLLDRAQTQPHQIVSNQLDFSGRPHDLDVQAVWATKEVAYYIVSLRKREEQAV